MFSKEKIIFSLIVLALFVQISFVQAGSISTPANGSYPIVTPPRTINYSLVPSVNNSIYWNGHAFIAGAVSSIESDPLWDSWYAGGVGVCDDGSGCGFITDGNTGWDNSYGFLTLINLTNYNPFNQVLNTTSDVHFNNINSSGNITFLNEKGNLVSLNNFVVHTQELMTDTLLDKSMSTLSCVGGQLNYTLYAFYGCGQFNFGGVLYPISGSPCVPNATVTLTCGTDTTPVTNYIYWELVAGVPTIKASAIYPSTDHIDTATFIVGACSGSTYTIYSYSRNRYEVDSFVKRVIERFEESGTLYVSGFTPTAIISKLNITTGEFFNGIFEMTSTNIVDTTSFYWINSSGNFVQATSLTSLNQYSDGTAFAGNERMNVIWGVVPINTTGGLGPTQVRLVAVPQARPGSVYISSVTAEQDAYNVINYYPSNSEVKNVFTPIARTILRASTSQFELFQSGSYLKDIRGTGVVGGGGGSTSIGGVLLQDGSTPLTGNWNYGSYNINGSGNYSQQNLTISQNSTTVKFNTGGKGWCIGNCP